MKDFSKMRLSLSSPEDIRRRSRGEVTKPETINYRTLVPESKGLFSEAIFGPVKDYACACGKYKGIRYRGVVCEKCGVEVTKSKVRRERMGHIELASPVAHIWYLKGTPNNMSMLLGISSKDLENVAYFNKYIVIEPGDSKFKVHDVITDKEYKMAISENPNSGLKIGSSAEALLECLSNIDLHGLKKEILKELESNDSTQKRKKLLRRLDVVKGFIKSGNKPEHMILKVLPVMPSDLRPMVQLGGGRFATSDVNELYRRVINRNRRLKKLKDMMAPDIILKNEKRMLQEAVDALIDNGRRDTPAITQGNRALKSLSDTLKGKQGRFRQNLLGKRVDYSGRSVIVVGPNLKLDQCGLPKKMALELYKPFIMRSLVQRGYATNIKAAKRMVDSEDEAVWSVADEAIKGHPVILNRAPTLHKFSMRAFYPVLIEGKAIRLHPLACSAFNADFDGDQAAVHLVLSPQSIMEAKLIMLADKNLISPANGQTIVGPSKEMLMGCYYATLFNDKAKGSGRIFASVDEARIAYQNGFITINAKIKVRIEGKLIDTTVGRVMLNDILPEDLRDYEKTFISSDFKKLISKLYFKYGNAKTAEVVNDIKDFGFEYATIAAPTIGIEDLVIPDTKNKIIEESTKKTKEVDEAYRKGKIISVERYRKTLDIWNEAVAKVTDDLVDQVDEFNPVYMMSKSGARGGLTQMRQLSGMRGLMANTQGKTMDVPIKSNFREGLTVLEFFMSSYGARKGAADRALRTADSGYLTRRLVDLAHDVIVKEEDCGTNEAIEVKAIYMNNKVVETLEERITGRYLLEDLNMPDGSVISSKELIDSEKASRIAKHFDSCYIRSPLTCKADKGICVKCFGADLSTNKDVLIGEAVGVVAAQSVSERTTQLTMRTFHTGGVAEQESSTDKIISEKGGTVKFIDIDLIKAKSGNVLADYGKIEVADEVYDLDMGSTLLVKDGQKIKEGDTLAIVDPHIINVISKDSGYIDYSELVISESIDSSTGLKERIVVKSSTSGSPKINLRNSAKGEIKASIHVREGAYLIYDNGHKIEKGETLAKIVKEMAESKKDITGGLPRVQQLLEARAPSSKAIISEIDGVVELLKEKKKGMRVVKVSNDEDEKKHLIPASERILFRNGETVKRGESLTDGTPYVGDILETIGIKEAQMYVVESIQKIYREQGINISEKHLEVVVKQMFKMVKIIDSGDSVYSDGEVMTLRRALMENEELLSNGKKPIHFTRVVQGITKAAVGTDSFISASSFQETTKVLSNAAIRGKVDMLEGLKENVIIGRRIPAGTGFSKYLKKGE